MLIPFFGFCIALLSGLIFGPLVHFYAWRWGFVDHPDTNRKVQANPVAFGGGIVIALAVGVGVMILFLPTLTADLRLKPRWGLLVASLIVIVIGIFDDRFGVRGKHKLFGQTVAAMIAANSGTLINNVDVFGVSFPLGVLGFAVAAVWVLGSINAFNLIDGVDGLASSVGLVISLALGCIFVYQQNSIDALIAFSLAGGLLAFLRWNWEPASMYLGDTGSMLIGLILGTVALHCAAKESATVAAAPLVAIWAILIFDSVAAVARRKLTGRSIYDCDRGHIHHRLLENGLSAHQVTLVIAGITAVTSLAAVLSIWLNMPVIGILVAAFVVVVLTATKVFGHVELKLASRRLVQAGKNSFHPLRSKHTTVDTMQLQGNTQWEQIWDSVLAVTEEFDLGSVRMNVHIARTHQDFYATWKAVEFQAASSNWEIDRPFVFEGVTYGRIVASGIQDDDRPSSAAEFCRFLDSLVPVFKQLVMDANNHSAGEPLVGGAFVPPNSVDGDDMRAKVVNPR